MDWVEKEKIISFFFWQHGEEESIIRGEMMRIYESSSRVVCVESCLRPDINVPGWWRDINICKGENHIVYLYERGNWCNQQI